MHEAMTEGMSAAIVDAQAALARAGEAATRASVEDLDAMVVVQRLHTVHGRSTLIDSDVTQGVDRLEDESVSVGSTLHDCREWLTDAAAILDRAVLSESDALLPPGLLTVRADIAETIRTVHALAGLPE